MSSGGLEHYHRDEACVMQSEGACGPASCGTD